MAEKRANPVDAYIDRYPTEVQRRLKQMRSTIRKAAPSASETISYGIPAFKTSKVLVWYGAFANHIGFYPGAGVVAAFKKDLAPYKFAKGSVQFPFDKPLPLPLVTKIVKFRVQATKAPAKAKQTRG